MCSEEGCQTQSQFEGGTELFCSLVGTQEEFVTVNRRSCKHEGCQTRPNFNFKGETKGLYCFTPLKI